MQSTEAPNGLKKLSFVPEMGTKGYTMATNVYSTAKSYVPAPIKTRIDQVEDTVSAISAPYISKAQDKGAELLKVVDSQVDKAVQGAGQMYQSNTSYISSQVEKQRAYHAQNLESYKAAREQYLKKVEESVEFVRTNGLTGAAKKAADEVTAAVSEARKLPGYVVKQVHEAFEKMLAFEPVQKALSATRPTVDAAYQRYDSLHGAVVRSPSYKKAVDLSQAAVSRAQETFVYKKAKDSLYPMVAKYADPALQSLTASTYYQAAVTHLMPQAVA